MSPMLLFGLVLVGGAAAYYSFFGRFATTPKTASEDPVKLPIVPSPKLAKRPTEAQLAAAKAIAPQLEAALIGNPNGMMYHSKLGAMDPALEKLVTDFQRAMNLIPDGLYGPVTAGALMSITGRPPPPPFFYEANQRVIIHYKAA